MLTLKTITTKANGLIETCLFSADSISHTERIEKQSTFVRIDDSWLFGSLPESLSDQPFIASDVFLYGEDRNLKQVIQILPRTDCFVMDDGKTIDSFYSHFQ